MKIAVFCSANNNIDPDFFAMTEEMGNGWLRMDIASCLEVAILV